MPRPPRPPEEFYNEKDYNEKNEGMKDYQTWLISFQRGL